MTKSYENHFAMVSNTDLCHKTGINYLTNYHKTLTEVTSYAF